MSTLTRRASGLAPRLLSASLLVVTLVVTALLLAGCTAGGGVSSAPSAPDVGTDGGAPVGAPAPLVPGDTRGEASGERKVARTASLTLAVPDAEAATQRIRGIAAARGGYLTYEQVSTREAGGSEPWSTITLSLPAEQLDAALVELAGVGTLLDRRLQAADVTDAVLDVEARITALEASIARISALMERAGTVAEIAQVETELARRQADLESLRAQQKYYAGITERSSVTVVLRSPATASTNPFWSGLAAGWEALGESVRFLLVAAGAVLPFLVVAALVGGPVLWWLLRRRRRAAPSGPPDGRVDLVGVDVAARDDHGAAGEERREG